LDLHVFLLPVHDLPGGPFRFLLVLRDAVSRGLLEVGAVSGAVILRDETENLELMA